MPDTTPAPLRRITSSPTRRVLIVANQTATSSALLGELRVHAERGPVQFHLVVPALNSHLRHWLSDTDDAMLAARRRAEEALSTLKSNGLPATAEIGDSVPLMAIGDALSQFRARTRFDVPVRHVIAGEEVVLAA